MFVHSRSSSCNARCRVCNAVNYWRVRCHMQATTTSAAPSTVLKAVMTDPDHNDGGAPSRRRLAWLVPLGMGIALVILVMAGMASYANTQRLIATNASVTRALQLR